MSKTEKRWSLRNLNDPKYQIIEGSIDYSKPLFRWTIGGCIDQGWDILDHAISKAVDIFGDAFSWVVCCNTGLKSLFDKRLLSHPVCIVKQNWHDGPIVVKDSSTLWKVCPPRLSLNQYEIICDNDIVLFEKCRELVLDAIKNNRPFCLEDPLNYTGYFAKKLNGKPLNSGFLGLPANWNYGEGIQEAWLDLPKSKLRPNDEQGLLTYVIYGNHPDCLIFRKEEFIELHDAFICSSVFGGESPKSTHHEKATYRVQYTDCLFNALMDRAVAVHFVRSNSRAHTGWYMYKVLNDLP